jgi:hypothetical protein
VVTVKKADFRVLMLVPHKKYITSTLQAQPVNAIRFEVFKAGTMKNAVFWDTETQFVPHRRHITAKLQSPAS